jgi:hypothetical protein
LLFPGILIAGCELFGVSMVDYFLDHSEGVEVAGFTVKTTHLMEGERILIPPGDATVVELALVNPRGFVVRQELLGAPPGSASRQIDSAEIVVTIAGAAEGEEYDLTLVMQSPDGLRYFPGYSLGVRCVSFETGLRAFRVNGADLSDLDPDQDAYLVNVPFYNIVISLGAETEHPGAVIEIYEGTDDSGGLLAKETNNADLRQLFLDVGDNHFYIKVTAPSSVARGYALTVHRATSSESGIGEFYFAIGSKRYGAGSGVENGSGSIDGDAITVTVPYGTDLSSLRARAVYTGNSINPDPAAAADYTGPVAYRVTAASGMASVYTVRVGEAKIAGIGDIVIPSGGFAGIGTDISGDVKAAITSVTGTDSLGAAIVLRPADYSVDPLIPGAAGVEMTATLRVPADKGSTGADIAKNFTVHILDGAKELRAFYFVIGAKRYGIGEGVESGSGSIDGNTITVSVPYGTDVTAMTAVAAHTGASISPDPAAPADYTGPVAYRVTAADGASETYTVTVGMALNPAKAITAFAIAGPVSAAGSISGDTITVTVPYGTNVASMTAAAAHTGASIDPDPAVARSYAGPVTYTVSAADGTSRAYTVTVHVALNPAKAITAFAIAGPVSAAGVIEETAKTITVNVPYGTNVTSMTATATHTGASIDPNPGTARSYAGPVTYTVTAADGTSQAYTVTVHVALNPAKAKTAFAIAGPVSAVGAIDETAKTITVNVPYGTDVTSMTAAATHTGASISPDPAAARSYAGPVEYTVTAADGTSRAYTVRVDTPKIASVTAVNGNLTSPHGFAKTGSDISGAVKAAITSVTGTDSLGNVITLAAADYSVDPLVPDATGTDTVATLRVPAVRSSTGADITKDFTVYIKNNAKEITAFAITSPVSATGTIDEEAKTITIIVPYGTAVTAMTATAAHTGASISPDPAAATDYANPVSYTVTAEDDTTQDYTITVNMRPGITISGITVKGLSALTFTGVSPSVVTQGESITITIRDDVNEVIVADSWYVEINGPVTSTYSDSETTVGFNAPATPGFYNVNVIATVGGVDYSGSFGLIVK